MNICHGVFLACIFHALLSILNRIIRKPYFWSKTKNCKIMRRSIYHFIPVLFLVACKLSRCNCGKKIKNCNAISNIIMEWVLRRWKYIYNFCVYFSGYCASKRCKHHWTCCLSNYHDIKERPQNCVTNQGEYTSYM